MQCAGKTSKCSFIYGYAGIFCHWMYTGCTRLGENNVNPKVMQYVMGHSDAQITMNIYNHIAEMSHVENEMSKMNLPETVPAVV